MSSGSKLSPLKRALIAVEEMQQKIKKLESGRSDYVAVIGMGCLFPKANNPNEFWDLLIEGRDAIEEVPISRWNINDFYDSDYILLEKWSRAGEDF